MQKIKKVGSNALDLFFDYLLGRLNEAFNARVVLDVTFVIVLFVIV